MAAAGFARTTASTNTFRFSSSFSSPKDFLPIGTWMMLERSTRYSTLPALISSIALVMSIVTVPLLGLGIRPLGPSTRPRRPTRPIISGVATQTSKSNQFSFWILAISSSAPTKSAPAFCASVALSPLAKTSTRTVRPVPWGSTTAPRTCWSAWRGSTPKRMDSSMVSSNLAFAVWRASCTASAVSYSLERSISSWLAR